MQRVKAVGSRRQSSLSLLNAPAGLAWTACLQVTSGQTGRPLGMGQASPSRAHKLAVPARRKASPEKSESLIVALICTISKGARSQGGTLTQSEEAKRRTRGWPGQPG